MNRIRLAAIAIGAFTIGVAALAWLFGISPMLAQAREAEQMLRLTSGELAVETRVLAELETAADGLPADRAHLALLEDRIPEEPKTEELTERFGELAERYGIVIQSLTFAEPAAVPGLAETDAELAARLFRLDVALRVIGDGAAVLEFIDEIQHNTRITLVHSVALTPGEVAIVELGGASIVLGPAVLPGAGAAAVAPEPTPAPTTESTPEPTTAP